MSNTELLDIVIRGCKRVPADQIARASVVGKNEGLFRDLTHNSLCESRTDLLTRAEWDTPPEAFERWSQLWPTGNRSKGMIDLAATTISEPLTSTLALGVEFKLWYWFDLLDQSKYAESGRNYSHLVSQSFVMDATKLLASVPPESGSRLIVTIVPTFHIEKIPTSNSKKRGDYLIERGFPKSYIGLSRVNVKKEQPHSAELRVTALKKFTDYLQTRGCDSVIGGELVGNYDGLIVTTDFVVSEVRENFRY